MSAHPSEVLGLHQLKDPDRHWTPNLQQQVGIDDFTEHLQKEGELYPLLSKKALMSCKAHLTFSLSYKERAASSVVPGCSAARRVDVSVQCRLFASRNSQGEKSELLSHSLSPKSSLQSYREGAGFSPRYQSNLFPWALIWFAPVLSLHSRTDLPPPQASQIMKGSCSLRSSCGSCQRGKGFSEKWKISGKSLMWKVNR